MKKILVVDGDENVCTSMYVGLTRKGYFVETAKNSVDGLKKAKKKSFNFILTDIESPNFNGAVLIPITTIFPEIKIILMLAPGSEKLEERLTKYPQLSKPFKITELLDILEN